MFKITLKRKIVFCFLLVGLLPLTVIAFLTIAQIQDSLKNTVNDHLISSANGVKFLIQDRIDVALANIETLAENPIIKSRETSKEEKLIEMKKIQDFYKTFEDITLINLNGNVIISTTYNYRGEWVTKKWYQEAKDGNTSISPTHIILSPFKVILSFTTPVRDKTGEIIAVIAGQLNMEEIWEITDGVKIGEKGFVFIVNREENFIAYPEKKKILSKVPYSQFIQKISFDSGIINYIDENGEEMICSFVSPSGTQLIEKEWKLIVTQPESEAFALVNIFRKQVTIIFFGGLALVLIISLLLSGSIVKPVKKLTDATKEIAAGKLGVKIKIKTGDEIEELASSFNRMTEDLEKSRESLEKTKASLEIKVKVRTTELEEAKSILEIKIQARTRELKEFTESLDQQVKQRTKELQEKMEELERFQKLAVGRELKMIELKEEIEQIKKNKT